MNETVKKGKLEVICGPMFSGKSEELIRRLRRAIIAKQKVAVFKHALDDRQTLEHIHSHNGSQIQAFPTDDALTILNHIKANPHFTVIGIDEVQFFSHDLIAVICELIDRGVRVIVSGLDLDFRGIPFGPIPTLLALADEIIKLSAICTQCGKEAHYTQRLVNNKPAKFDDPIIKIGAQEHYDSRCRNCYSIDKIPTFAAWQKQK